MTPEEFKAWAERAENRDRWQKLIEGRVRELVTSSPDWPHIIVEYTPSPLPYSSLCRKIEAHFQGGARKVWLVDFVYRDVTIMRSLLSLDIFEGEQELPGIGRRVSELFRVPRNFQA